MRTVRLAIGLVLVSTLVAERATATAADRPDGARPHIVLIMADDLGFSDLGCYGGEIATPHLDRLAAEGLRFTQFYNTARCWPTRAAVLTGYYAQQVRRDALPGVGGGSRGERPAWAPLLSARLKAAGYRSYHSGKWHVDGKPLENGFDRSYSLDDHDRHFAPRQHQSDDRPLPPVDPRARYYSSTAIADHAIAFLTEHAAEHAERPLFAFIAFTAPHFPLQAPADDIARYRARYQLGWDTIRQQRWEKLRTMPFSGLSLSAVEQEIGPPYPFPEALKTLGPGEVNRPLAWDQLAPEQQRFQAAKMAVHAAMVDRMDQEIGRLLDTLDALKLRDNTLVMFCSDNGASAEIMVRGDGHDPHAECGTGATFVCLGPGWSTVANTPFRRHKTWVHEGGIATPLIMNWPRGIAARGDFRSTPAHVIDLVPTCLELAGVRTQTGKEQTGEEHAAPQFPGRSLVPALAKNLAIPRPSLWWLHEGNRAVRVGDWKLVAAGKESPWELYDLATDRSETSNRARELPAKRAELEAAWDAQLSTIKRDANRK